MAFLQHNCELESETDEDRDKGGWVGVLKEEEQNKSSSGNY